MDTSYPGYSVKDRPTQDDAQEAVKALWKPFEGFELDEPEKARSIALLCALTAAVRPTLATAPGIAISAPSASSGKTLLCQLLAVIADGDEAAPLSMPVGFEEQGKTLFAALRGTPSVLLFDNLVARFDSAPLCSLITSGLIQGRELGHSRTYEIPSRALILANGNGLSMAGDVSSRFLYLRLAPRHERPQDRHVGTFEIPSLISWAKMNRLTLVAAAHTIIRAYIQEVQRTSAIPESVAARRLMPGCRFPMLETLRDALLWCGEGDGFMGFNAASEHDSEREERRMVFDIIEAAIMSANARDNRATTAPVTTKRIVEEVHTAGASDTVDHVMLGGRSTRIAGTPISPIPLSRWLTRTVEGVVFDGKRLRKLSIHNQAHYAIEEIK